MSGFRCCGSSWGSGRCSICDPDFARWITFSANSSIVNSPGLPRLTGPVTSWPVAIMRRKPSTRSSTKQIAFYSQRTAALLRAWLDLRGPDIPWLFCPVYQGKPVNRDLSTTTVKRLVKDAAKLAGLDPNEVAEFSGHSLRVGAAQDLLRRGFDTAAIMRAGGWKSINVLVRYLEKDEHNVWG
jgi:integrase